jgi:UDP-N-acetylmuramyl-tripeptide synthetase
VQFMVCEGDVQVPLTTQVLGNYNVSNLLGVIATLRTLGVPLVDAVLACHALQPVPGRMAFQGGEGLPLAVVDYAHTPDALTQVLQALRPLAVQRGGKLICVFGCGGDRDPIKRPLMGAAASRHADAVLITSDNPRSEDPQQIARQVQTGAATAHLELDRARAIANTLAQAAAADVVLIAGKGHEDYQDVQEIQRALQLRVHEKKGARA